MTQNEKQMLIRFYEGLACLSPNVKKVLRDRLKGSEQEMTF